MGKLVQFTQDFYPHVRGDVVKLEKEALAEIDKIVEGRKGETPYEAATDKSGDAQAKATEEAEADRAAAEELETQRAAAASEAQVNADEQAKAEAEAATSGK